jgi:hypothetical protein
MESPIGMQLQQTYPHFVDSLLRVSIIHKMEVQPMTTRRKYSREFKLEAVRISRSRISAWLRWRVIWM